MLRRTILTLGLAALAGCSQRGGECEKPSRVESIYPYTGAGEWSLGEQGAATRVCLYQRDAVTVSGSVGGSPAVGLVHSDGTLVLALTRGREVGVVQLVLASGRPRLNMAAWSRGGGEGVQVLTWKHPW